MPPLAPRVHQRALKCHHPRRPKFQKARYQMNRSCIVPPLQLMTTLCRGTRCIAQKAGSHGTALGANTKPGALSPAMGDAP
jgi:hypothetical protein